MAQTSISRSLVIEDLKREMMMSTRRSIDDCDKISKAVQKSSRKMLDSFSRLVSEKHSNISMEDDAVSLKQGIDLHHAICSNLEELATLHRQNIKSSAMLAMLRNSW